MSSLPQILAEFAYACQTRYGAQAASHNDDGAFVAVDDRIIHVNLDQNANRAVVWTELAKPERAAFDVLETAAMRYTARELLATGLVVGINRSADLILLGRSIEQDALVRDEGVDLVAEVAREAAVATAALAEAAASAATAKNAAPEAGDAVIFRN